MAGEGAARRAARGARGARLARRVVPIGINSGELLELCALAVHEWGVSAGCAAADDAAEPRESTLLRFFHAAVAFDAEMDS